MYCFRKRQSSKAVFVSRPYKAQARSQAFSQSKGQTLIIASIRKLNEGHFMLYVLRQISAWSFEKERQ